MVHGKIMWLHFHTYVAAWEARSLEKGPLQMLELYGKFEGSSQLASFNRDRHERRLSCLKAGPYFAHNWGGSGSGYKASEGEG